MNHHRLRALLRPLSLPSLALACAASLCAQPPPASSPASAQPEEETLMLSPFTVNTDKDVGYLATDSLVGGRLSTELIKTPSDISILTSDFLNDIGAINYQDASAYLTNTYVTPIAGQDFGAQNNFRGLGGGYPTRNYFKHNDALDYYNVERVESARGPNALLFGDGIVGGVINTMTKQAKPGRKFTQLGLRSDSEGSLRGTVDYNVSFGRDAALRLNLVKEGDRSWADSYFRNRVGATLAGTYRPWKQGEFRFEAETGDVKQNWATQSFSDSLSTWNGVPFVGPATANPAGSTGISRFTTDRLTQIPGVGIVNLLNFAATTGSNFAIESSKAAYIPNLPSIARNLSLQPSNTVGDTRRHLFAVFYQHEWTPNLASEVAFQAAGYKRATYSPRFSTLVIDPNSTLPGGAVNPHFRDIYADSAPLLQDQDNRHYDTRLVTAYALPITKWKQRLNALLSRRVEYFYALDQRWMRNNNPAVPLLTSGANQYNVREYLGDHASLVPLRPADDSTFTWEEVPTRYRSQRQQLDTKQLATVANFWRDRLTVIGGVRFDSYESYEYAIGTFNAVTGRPATTAILQKEIKAKVVSGGFTLFPIPQLGAYANYSETFNPIGAGDPSLYAKQFDQTDGTGYSGGLRFKLFNSRIVGSLGYYDTTEANRVTGYSTSEINRIWTNINRVEKTFPTAYRDTSDVSSKGYEIDLVANATKDLRIRTNFAVPKTKQSNALPDTIRYLAENQPIWEAAKTLPTTTNVNQINSDIATLVSRIQAGNEGRALNGQADYTGSIFGNYNLPSGFVKGASLGAGMVVIGRRIVGNQLGNSYDYIKAPAYYTFNASAGYTIKPFKKNIRLQLNVNNLLDYDEPVYTGIGTRSGRNYRNGFYYIEPRKFILSATLDL